MQVSDLLGPQARHRFNVTELADGRLIRIEGRRPFVLRFLNATNGTYRLSHSEAIIVRGGLAAAVILPGQVITKDDSSTDSDQIRRRLIQEEGDEVAEVSQEAEENYERSKELFKKALKTLADQQELILQGITRG